MGELVGVDCRDAVELAPRVWWVGSMLPGDEFQCHVYLIEQGDQSVLIDAGQILSEPAVTVSVGVAMRWQGESCHALVARADQALYEAKATGRDKVDVAA